MSFFVRIPNPPATLLSLTADGSKMFFNGDCGTAEQPCVFASTATDAELRNNSESGKGCQFRMDAMLVRPLPPSYAFFTQFHGVTKYLSYNPDAETLTLSETVGEGETFQMRNENPSLGEISILNVHHAVFLAVCEVGGKACIRGVKEACKQCYFVFDSILGTGPLMPKFKYFITTVFGTQLRATNTKLVQAEVDHVDEEFYIEPLPNTAMKAPFFYRLRTDKGKYVALDRPGNIMIVDGSSFADPTNDEANFGAQFVMKPCPEVFGSYRVLCRLNGLGLRAEVDDMSMTTASYTVVIARDLFTFQTVPVGVPVDVASGGKKKRAVTLSTCPRDYPGIHGRSHRQRTGGLVAEPFTEAQRAAMQRSPPGFFPPSKTDVEEKEAAKPADTAVVPIPSGTNADSTPVARATTIIPPNPAAAGINFAENAIIRMPPAVAVGEDGVPSVPVVN